MKSSNKPTDASAHQTVTDFIRLKSAHETIQIGFTDQKISGRAGMLSFAGFLHWHGFGRLLASVIPFKKQRRRGYEPFEYVLSFLTGILAGARKLTQVAHLRTDVMLSQLMAIAGIPSQSALSRFFSRFDSAGTNLKTFRPLWRWCLGRLCTRPGGYALDLDSTRLLHEDGHQEGVAPGYTRLGTKPCLHPLIAVLGEAKLVAGFWLRPGNSSCANNVVAFTLDLLSYLPSFIHLRVVRADSGFCVPEWLELLESRGLRFIVVARLLQPLQRLLRKDQIWEPTEVAGTEVAEVWHQEKNWALPRRVVLLRHRVAEKKRPGGKKLIDCPGYVYQALVTNLPESVPPIGVWREYNRRAGCEEVIKQLDADFALPHLCLGKFWSTEAALSLAIVSYNLCVLFQRKLGWLERVTAATLRYRLFTTGGIISNTAGRTTIRLGVPEQHRGWWRQLLAKLWCDFPNCNAISQSPG
jgi:hypothetical protein